MKCLISIIMGSDSDYKIMKEAEKALKHFSVSFETKVVSAHRTPREMVQFAESAAHRGVKVIIAGAGGAAHLPGMVASITELPVIGVPISRGVLKGQDAFLSIAQMPQGVPVATVAIDNAWNAGLLAVQILATEDVRLRKKLKKYKNTLRKKVLKKKVGILPMR